MALVWDNPTIERLKELWADGLSASQIARILRGTRNQIIGKIHRLNLVSPNSKQRTTRTRSRNAPIPKSSPYVAKISLPEPEAIGPLEDFPFNGCKYPHGDPSKPGWRCCGQPQKILNEGKPNQVTLPYCEFHQAKCHEPNRPRNLYPSDVKINGLVSPDDLATPISITSYGHKKTSYNIKAKRYK